jgi:hypothetical protein
MLRWERPFFEWTVKMMALLIFCIGFFPGPHGDVEVVGPRRQRTAVIIIVHAIGVISLVEIERDQFGIGVGLGHIQETPTFIGLGAIGLIGKGYKKQAVGGIDL